MGAATCRCVPIAKTRRNGPRRWQIGWRFHQGVERRSRSTAGTANHGTPVPPQVETSARAWRSRAEETSTVKEHSPSRRRMRGARSASEAQQLLPAATSGSRSLARTTDIAADAADAIRKRARKSIAAPERSVVERADVRLVAPALDQRSAHRPAHSSSSPGTLSPRVGLDARVARRRIGDHRGSLSTSCSDLGAGPPDEHAGAVPKSATPTAATSAKRRTPIEDQGHHTLGRANHEDAGATDLWAYRFSPLLL